MKIVLSKYESDYAMAKYADTLIESGVNCNDITIISRDSDMCILNNKVSI